MNNVQLRKVGKVYAGGFEAVRQISIDIPDGAFCVLVGPSGCGKSTLLRMVAGLETITSGEVAIGDKVVNALDPSERDIAMVFQNYALYPHMSVYDNMAYGLRNRGTPKPEIETRVQEAARILEIGHLLDRKPRALSGGQRQRVAMGRAIVRKPRVFLFDEPLSNLDAKLRIQMRVEIKKLQRALGITSIYVTHDQLEAMTLADMLVVMNKGKVEQMGPPLALYEKPQTTFVAGFIGAPPMNLVEVPAGGMAGLTLAHPPQVGRFILGIRPEHFQLSSEDAGPSALVVELTLTAVEAVGSETFLYGAIGGAGREIIVRVPGKADIAIGTKLRAVADAHDLHFFHAETGDRLPD
ncbi:MAG: sn-glycerol-3-phosphate ABC transporter ATP-binding protein UgpC [Rhizobiales bacterium PAR1]|nr:MAG: sn-glycerol-3-phosphate ABC transporter ATP-binding protein UgpC [Rhizobiales bacterium PAR1]